MGIDESGNMTDRVRTSSSSRFAYHGDEPTEGGVRSVAGGGGSGHGRGVNGAPGPADRLLDISELARTVGMRYRHSFLIPPYPEDDIEYAGPVVGEITLTNTGGLLLLRGTVRANLRLECTRCLATVDADVESDLEEEFDLVATRNAFHQEEVQAVDEDSPASVIKANVLDLGELLRQNLLLAAPLQPLCREECAGIPDAGVVLRTADDEENGAPAESGGGDNPLRHLGEMLAARERAAEDSDDAG